MYSGCFLLIGTKYMFFRYINGPVAQNSITGLLKQASHDSPFVNVIWAPIGANYHRLKTSYTVVPRIFSAQIRLCWKKMNYRKAFELRFCDIYGSWSHEAHHAWSFEHSPGKKCAIKQNCYGGLYNRGASCKTSCSDRSKSCRNGTLWPYLCCLYRLLISS